METNKMNLNGGRPPIVILGVPFDLVTMREALERVETMIASRRPHYVVTANVDFVVQAQDDVELRRIFLDAHLVLCDGTPLVWASRLLGNALPERVAGADIVPLLLQLAASRGYRVFLLGATPESLEKAIGKLAITLPELVIAGYYSPPFSKLLDMDHEDISRRIQEARPDVLLVALGCPKQEKWIAMHYRKLGVPVSIGVGATIDFLAGSVRRAPRWMQRAGIEWAFRLVQEPRRLARRYATDLFVFGRRILRQGWEMKHSARSLKATMPLENPREESVLSLPPRLDLQTVVENGFLPSEWLEDPPRHCLLEASAVEFMDSTGVGLLVRLQRVLRTRGLELVVVAPSLAFQKTLNLMKLAPFFSMVPDLRTAELLIERYRRDSSGAASTSRAERLAWRGEITAVNAESLWEGVRSQIDELQPGESLLLHLALVRFIDSSGLGLMIRAKKRAEQQGKQVIFKNPQPAVRNVIRIARLEQFLLADASGASALPTILRR